MDADDNNLPNDLAACHALIEQERALRDFLLSEKLATEMEKHVAAQQVGQWFA